MKRKRKPQLKIKRAPRKRRPLRDKFTLTSEPGTRLTMHPDWPFVAERDDILDKRKGKQ